MAYLVPDDLWAAPAGILFVRRTGIQWHALHRALLERLHRAGQLNWGRAALDSAAVPAKRGRGARPRSTSTRRATTAAAGASVYLKIRRKQAGSKNCTTHYGNLLPFRGRDILAQG